MNILMDLASHLEAAEIGQLGTDLFVNQLPETLDGTGALLFTTGEGLRQHTTVSGYYRGIVYLSVRARDSALGEALADNYFQALHLKRVQLEHYNVDRKSVV